MMITARPTPSSECSGRYSDRPAWRPHAHPVIPGLWPITGPEVSAGSTIPAPHAERRVPAGPGRISRDALRRLARRLTDRDRAILDSLRLHRFLTSTQLQHFHFLHHESSAAAARVCRRVLGRLAELRVIEHLDRRVGGLHAGSTAHIWRIGLIGDRLLRLEEPDQPRGRLKEPSLRHLEHCLAVADVHLTLQTAAREHDDLELLQVQGEPDCWRRYHDTGGAIELLKPDLAATTASGDFQDDWFIELDRGTESLPTLLRKCAQYEAYRQTGAEQDQHGVFPQVVWVMASDGHRERLEQAIRTARDLTTDLFRICTLPGLTPIITGAAA